MATENTNNNPTYTWLNFGYDIAGAQLNAATSYGYNRNLMSYQNELNKDYASWNYSNAYALQRAGLEKAGYNPILAVNNGTSFAGGSVGGSSVNVSDSNLGTNAFRVRNETKQTSLQSKAIDSQVATNASTQEANHAQAVKATEEAKTQASIRANNQAQTALTNVNTQLAQKDLSWKDRLNLNQIKTNIINAQANQANAVASQIGAGASVTNAKAHYIDATTGNPWKIGSDVVKRVTNWSKNPTTNFGGSKVHWKGVSQIRKYLKGR